MPLLLWKYKYWLIGLIFVVLYVGQIAYTNHLANKLKIAEQKYDAKIQAIKEQQRQATEKLNEQLFIVSNELEAERNNIKIEFRDIRHETQKIITDRIYTDCKLNDDGLHIANKAIDSANTSKPND